MEVALALDDAAHELHRHLVERRIFARSEARPGCVRPGPPLPRQGRVRRPAWPQHPGLRRTLQAGRRRPERRLPHGRGRNRRKRLAFRPAGQRWRPQRRLPGSSRQHHRERQRRLRQAPAGRPAWLERPQPDLDRRPPWPLMPPRRAPRGAGVMPCRRCGPLQEVEERHRRGPAASDPPQPPWPARLPGCRRSRCSRRPPAATPAGRRPKGGAVPATSLANQPQSARPGPPYNKRLRPATGPHRRRQRRTALDRVDENGWAAREDRLIYVATAPCSLFVLAGRSC